MKFLDEEKFAPSIHQLDTLSVQQRLLQWALITMGTICNQSASLNNHKEFKTPFHASISIDTNDWKLNLAPSVAC